MTEITGSSDTQRCPERVFYDGACPLCTGAVERLEGVLRRRRIVAVPLQAAWVRERLGLLEGESLTEMRVQTARGEVLGGADAVVHLARAIWWAWPLWVLGRIPPAMRLLRGVYRWIALHRACAGRSCGLGQREGEGTMTMHVALTGSSGLIGTAVAAALAEAGFTVTRMVRGASAVGKVIRWDPENGVEDLARLEGIDAVVHLAGESLSVGRWTVPRKEAIRRSRVEGTARLSESLAMVPRPPKVLVCASAIGIYGNRGQEILTEESPPGNDFLATLCREWEAASEIAAKAGVRVVHLRFGVVLSPTGGALKKMLLPFRLGAGGCVGDGGQFMSWIALDDAAAVVHHALVTESLQGAVNAVAPAPVTNAEFTRTLARILHRPALFPMPASVARLVFGEVADALLLASQRVAPTRLQASNYRFRHPDLEGALKCLLQDEHHGTYGPRERGSKVWQ